MSEPQAKLIRKSERTTKKRTSYSPEPKSSRKIQNDKRKSSVKLQSCINCKRSFILEKPRKLKNTRNKNICNESTNMCAICAMEESASKKKSSKDKANVPAVDKDKYLEDARIFAKSLVEVLQDDEAERLYCPEIKTRPCACLQKYILTDVNESQQRALLLLNLLKEAKRLSSLKSYSKEKLASASDNADGGKKTPGIGLGKGQKKSKEFEEFVLQQRIFLREEVKLCERACQKVLFYSNNFLHKKLKTEPDRGQRVERKKGKAALGNLVPIAKLSSESCCKENCVIMASTHATLIQQWRERVASSQAEAWKVLAEMLTPSGGGKINCFKFIEKVTGCSHSTISKVNQRMSITGGDREPPEHGLKKWWQEQASKFNQTNQITASDACDEVVLSLAGNSAIKPTVIARKSSPVVETNSNWLNISALKSNHAKCFKKVPVTTEKELELYVLSDFASSLIPCSDVPEAELTDPLLSAHNIDQTNLIRITGSIPTSLPVLKSTNINLT